MASIREYKAGWLASIRKKGISKSKTFKTKTEAKQWATKIENEINLKKNLDSKYPFSYAVKRYMKEITPLKKTADKEIMRLNNFLNDPVCMVAMEDLTPAHFEDWAKRRQETVTSSTALREWNIISNICHKAVGKWKLLNESPMTHAIRPKKGKARDRLPTQDEIEKLFFVMDYVEYQKPEKLSQIVGACFLFALHTALRSQEIYNLKWDDISEKTAYIAKTKTGHPRTIPLSKNAVRVVNSMQGLHKVKVFPINGSQLDSNFRKYRKNALIKDLQFRDSRHYALTNMAKKVDVMNLAKISGHRDLKILLNVYYNPDIGELSDLLD